MTPMTRGDEMVDIGPLERAGGNKRHMQVRVLSTMGHYIEAYCIDRVARSVLRVAPVSVFQYGELSPATLVAIIPIG